MKPRYVMDEDWDYLIVLDACRYDYFVRFYQDYLNGGTLEKAISPATWTLAWAEKNFIEYYDDVVYISTVPFINSMKEVSWHGNRFDGRQHFFKVVDAWNQGWVEELRAIPPKNVTKIALKEIIKNPEKRLMIHYCQPHQPFLIYPKLNKKHYYMKRKQRFGLRKDTIAENVKIMLADGLVRTGGTELIWKLNFMFQFIQPRYMERVWRHLGQEGIIAGYTDNLVKVLQEVQGLLPYLSGQVVITADHGEMLGEAKLYGHGDPLPSKPELVEVPWYAVECQGEKSIVNAKDKESPECNSIKLAVNKLIQQLHSDVNKGYP